jgi:hypothetical protein
MDTNTTAMRTCEVGTTAIYKVVKLNGSTFNITYPGQRTETFLFAAVSRPVLGPAQSLSEWVRLHGVVLN